MALRTPQHNSIPSRESAGPIVNTIVEPLDPGSEGSDPYFDGQSSRSEEGDEQNEHREY